MLLQCTQFWHPCRRPRFRKDDPAVPGVFPEDLTTIAGRQSEVAQFSVVFRRSILLKKGWSIAANFSKVLRNIVVYVNSSYRAQTAKIIKVCSARKGGLHQAQSHEVPNL